MDKAKKYALKFLKNLEGIFPYDMIHSFKSRDIGEYSPIAVQTLLDNGLIEPKEYPIKGLPKDEPNKVRTYKITSKGIEFLNGERQKKTNRLLIYLTILLIVIGIIQVLKLF